MGMTVGSLFSGVGGMDLGLQRAGMTIKFQVEIDDYCLKVLNKHWPDVPKYKDVRDVGKHNLETVDLIAGGFPCTPHSVAGKRKGAADDRNLWPEFIRIIRDLKPRFVLGENVPGIITTYLDTVLSDLEGEGYTCATFNIPACAFDAPHRRERIFVVADARLPGLPESARERIGGIRDQKSSFKESKPCGRDTTQRTYWTVEPALRGMVDGISRGLDGGLNADEGQIQIPRAEVAERLLRRVWSKGELEHTPQRQKLEQQFARKYPDLVRALSYDSPLGDRQETVAQVSTFLRGLRQAINARSMQYASLPFEEAWKSLSQEDKDWVRMGALRGPWWSEWPNTPRVATGIPNRVDRLRGLGNAVVPQVAQYIGERIIEFAVP